jgi:hypothetical protein
MLQFICQPMIHCVYNKIMMPGADPNGINGSLFYPIRTNKYITIWILIKLFYRICRFRFHQKSDTAFLMQECSDIQNIVSICYNLFC